MKSKLEERQKLYLENALFLYNSLKIYTELLNDALKNNDLITYTEHLYYVKLLHNIIYEYNYKGFKHCEYYLNNKEKIFVSHYSYNKFITKQVSFIEITRQGKESYNKYFNNLFKK